MTNAAILEEIANRYFWPAAAILAFMVILIFIFPTQIEFRIATWILSAICLSLLMNFKKFKTAVIKIYNKRKPILWEILLVLIGLVVTWFVGVIFSLIEILATRIGG